MDTLIPRLISFLIASAILAFVFGLLFLPAVLYKLKAKKLGVTLSWEQVVGQRIRKTLTEDILEAAALAVKEGISVSFAELETHKLAGGDPYKVIRGVMYNKSYGMTFQDATALDLAGLEITMEELNRLMGK